jgi:RNA polymerase sigma-70 factor, ECF subfamily
MDSKSDTFITLLTSSQASIYASILVMLPDRAAAHDILQETNLTLFHKAAEFEAGTDFLAWACRIAHFHVLNQRKKLQRERLIFDEAFLSTLASGRPRIHSEPQM